MRFSVASILIALSLIAVIQAATCRCYNDDADYTKNCCGPSGGSYSRSKCTVKSSSRFDKCCQGFGELSDC
ncbi:hypothetical protein K7432_014668 [Basidiobolus ranarum]|uniref:Uncharacterized protein n=1 Tax=Basidiobolus ranarum TaxID=34480 RepID=A0ABR2VPB0_9FUNG